MMALCMDRRTKRREDFPNYSLLPDRWPWSPLRRMVCAECWPLLSCTP
jgi:hypothetical protein